MSKAGKPQLEDGYTKIANEILDALCQFRIPGEQRQCLDFILRKTYGYNKKVDAISNSQFVLATGLKRGNVSRAVKCLVDKKIVIKNDNRNIPTYCFNKKYKQWKVLSKKQPVIKSDSGVIKSDNKVLSKVMPTKEKKETIQKKIYGTFKNVHLTDVEFFKLKDKFNSLLQDKIDTLSEGIESKGYKYKNHYATILSWHRKEEREKNKGSKWR